MLRIRLKRVGRKHDPSFRVVVVPKKSGPKSGKYVENLGSYDPRNDENSVDPKRASYWLDQGAQPSDTVYNLFVEEGIIDDDKVNALPKKTPIESDESAETEEAGTESDDADDESESKADEENESTQEAGDEVEEDSDLSTQAGEESDEAEDEGDSEETDESDKESEEDPKSSSDEDDRASEEETEAESDEDDEKKEDEA